MAIVPFGFHYLLFFATIISSTCCAFTITGNSATATAKTSTFTTTMNQSKTSLLSSSRRGHHDDTNSSNANISSASTSNKMKLTLPSLTTTSTTRRSTVGTIMSTMMLFFLPFSSCPQSAIASYGDSTKIELPNYIEYLIEKNASVDSSKILYKGADMEVQLKRISDASLRLKDIPSIAREKKWSQIQGILTGPLGTLVQTMNALNKGLSSSSSSAADEEAAKVASAKVKADLIRISQEATKKDEMGVIKAAQQAQDDLEAFARLVF
jgi:hypothetical protein